MNLGRLGPIRINPTGSSISTLYFSTSCTKGDLNYAQSGRVECTDKLIMLSAFGYTRWSSLHLPNIAGFYYTLVMIMNSRADKGEGSEKKERRMED